MKKGEMLEKALVLMVNAHSGQLDRGGKPYQLHPLNVMVLLKSDDEELQCIALLHDVIEDSDVTFKQLEEVGMSKRVIDAVKLLTKMPGQTHEEYMGAIKTNLDAVLVKMADLTHNSDIRRLKGVREKDKERMFKYHMMYLELREVAEKF